MVFTPTEDFWCEETQSMYCKGLPYTTQPPNYAGMDPKHVKGAQKRHGELVRLVPDWIKGGKVVEGGPVTGVSGLGG